MCNYYVNVWFCYHTTSREIYDSDSSYPVSQVSVSALQPSACILSISVLPHNKVKKMFAVRALSFRSFTPTATLASTHNTYNDKQGYLWGSYGAEK